MVGPLYIIAIALGTAFSLGFFKKANRNIPFAFMFLAMAFMTFISGQWLYAFIANQQEAIQIFTAGFQPPFSISLQMGLHEAVFVTLINVIGLLSAIYLYEQFRDKGVQMMMVFILLFMGLNVIIMTRDIFNLFVFLEIASIATAGLIILEKKSDSTVAGFKYIIATGIISGILLIGIIALYYFSGSLFIDDIINTKLFYIKGGIVAIFLIFIAIILELKPFPANGWALDVYQAAHPGVSAIISAAAATASLYVLFKLMPMAGGIFNTVIAGIGVFTFIFSNLLGLKQKNPNRLLGYSSIAQIGLMVAIIGLQEFLGNQFIYILLTILITHFLAKAGLFWISGIVKKDKTKDWSLLRNNKVLLVLFTVFILALSGMPPFPGFFGKWELILSLSQSGHFYFIAAILLGSFFEIVYLFKWLGFTLKNDIKEEVKIKVSWNKFLSPFIFGIALFVGAFYASQMNEYAKFINFIPLAFALAFLFIDFLPVYIKNTIAILGLGFYYYTIHPDLESYRLIFASIFLAGGMLTLVAGYAYKGKRKGFYPVALMMFAGLIGLIEAKSMLEFFFAWEIMTIGSYFLIIRGKNSRPHAYSYMLFSMGGAYAILAAFGLASIGQASLHLEILANLNNYAPLIFVLLAIGFMTKTASVGLHIWLPGAHAEAETDVSPMVSAILLKGGLFGLVMMMVLMGDQTIGNISVSYILGWIGAISALVGNLMAALQEDAKRLLAYSSVGVMGYALFGLALMSHLGWLGAISIAVMHFMFKAMLFLAIGGVVWRVKTKYMYRMGGLIKKMPFSFISVLIGIIVLAGIPPLTGFGGKWLFFNAIMEKQWYLQGALVSFAGIIAFLYCFRLIAVIFLGQLKDEHREVKEAPFWILLPQYIIITVLMVFSVFPNSLLKPIGEFLTPIFPVGALQWDGQLATSLYGYWNGKLVMYVVVAIFAVVLGWLIFWSRKIKKVGQFNIVYAAERPERPETTHYGYNFFAHYKKAIGILAEPLISNFWESVSEITLAVADKIRRIFNGNGQTYLLHIVAYILIVYLLTFGGF
ncbi:MAG: proton-conducting transporter membrane subunit [Bacteroidota bacterium]